jgi:hypothetical protein
MRSTKKARRSFMLSIESVRESSATSRLKSLVAVVGIVAVSVVAYPASATAESAVTVNRGACMSELGQTGQTDLMPYQAPGTTGNGPLTIVNGVKS